MHLKLTNALVELLNFLICCIFIINFQCKCFLIAYASSLTYMSFRGVWFNLQVFGDFLDV